MFIFICIDSALSQGSVKRLLEGQKLPSLAVLAPHSLLFRGRLATRVALRMKLGIRPARRLLLAGRRLSWQGRRLCTGLLSPREPARSSSKGAG